MLVDLSHRLNNHIPTYPGDPEVEVAPAKLPASADYRVHELHLGTHSGTHIDAPSHMIKNGKTLDKIKLDTFIGQGHYMLVKNGHFDLEAIKAAGIKPGEIVIFNTQMSYKFYDKEYFTDFPVMSEEVAHYLVKQKVKMVGVDAPSVDNTPDKPVHNILLKANIPIIENLTNVEQLSGMQSATIFALPLRLDLDGAPARVIAEVY